MKVVTAPYTFTGVLAPEDLNRVYLYGRDVIEDIREKRWAKFLVPYQFVTDVNTPYNQASGVLLEHRFICPVTCVVTRAFLAAQMVSSAEVTVNITKVSGGSTPSGCSVPWLTTGTNIPSATPETTDSSQDRFQLEALTEYKITVASAGTFTLDRFDLTLEIAIDRFATGSFVDLPDFDPDLFSDATARNANTVLGNNADMATAAAMFAAALTAPTPSSYQVQNIVAATDADQLHFAVPRFSSARAQCVAKRLFVYAAMSATTGTTIKAELKTQGGSVLATATATVTGLLQATGDSGAVSVALSGAFSPATQADDLQIVFTNGNATNCLRARAELWMARA